MLDMQSGVREFVDTGDRAELQAFREAVADYPGQARTLDRLTGGQPALHAQAAAISTAIAGYVRGWATPVTRLGQSNRAAAQRAVAAGTGRRLVNGIRQRFTRLDRAQLTMQAGAAGPRAARRHGHPGARHRRAGGVRAGPGRRSSSRPS